ncbi:MAG TPA: histone deacetylase [Dongiaceae bacterium]|nr:histone deacetylase [Dongiaceae bacterium]
MSSLPFKLVYHPGYDLNLGPHVFPSQKFRLLHELLLCEGIASPGDVLRPQRVCDEDLLRVHTAEWVGKLRHGTLSHAEVMKLEVPYSPELAEAVWLSSGGTILAAEYALRDGFASNLGGGFHHAHANHGEGFCAINDVAVAVRSLQSRGAISRAIVVDTDVHHGNGTAHIFRGDTSVFTLSIHQQNNYPAYKPPSTLDLGLDDGVEDEEYLGVLLPAVENALNAFAPEILFYVGGADPYADDQLGGLRLSKSGLKARDKGVFLLARERGIPVVTTLAGGYARRVEDTIRIHANTIVAAGEVLRELPSRSGAASA